METITFSYNWNNKLDATAFTTFRLHNPKKYKIGENYMITLKNQQIKEAVIVDIKKIKLNQINDFISHIDTGYNTQDFVKLVKTMYKSIEDIDNKDFDFILLKTTKTLNQLPQ